MSASSSRQPAGAGFDYYCVLDFEATCDDSKSFSNQEIIEFPVVVLDGKSHKVAFEFHHYVRPLFNPVLTPFCTQLTGIQQETVAKALPFTEVFSLFEKFMETHFLSVSKTFIFVTCGDWDLKTMLPKQCDLSSLPVPGYMRSWINIKQAFGVFYKVPRPRGMTEMLQMQKLPLVGRHHSGIDDSHNIAAVLNKMLKDGYVGQPTFRGFAGKIPEPSQQPSPSPQPAKAKGKEKEKELVPQKAAASASSSAPPPSSNQATKGNPHARLKESPFNPSDFSKYHLVDVGVNLSHRSFANDLPGLLTRSDEGGVKTIVAIGTSVQASLRGQSICSSLNSGPVQIRFTAGVHPHDAKTCDSSTLSKLAQMAKDKNCVAVGECGLDFDRNFSPQEVQEHWFEEQIKLAIQLKKPLYLHERSAHLAFVRILSKYQDALKNSRVLVHCFTGPESELRSYIAMGFYIGITGWLNDTRGENLRKIVSLIPDDRLMIETDSPFLAPKNIIPRPSHNEPCLLGRVAETLAECRGVSVEKLIELTTKNALKFFSILPK